MIGADRRQIASVPPLELYSASLAPVTGSYVL